MNIINFEIKFIGPWNHCGLPRTLSNRVNVCTEIRRTKALFKRPFSLRHPVYKDFGFVIPNT